MKYKNKLKRLNDKIVAFERNTIIQEELRLHPGSFTKPGSLKKR